MKNKAGNGPKELPKDLKFSTFESGNEDDILLELLMVNLIHNGSSFESLIKGIEILDNEKDKREMKEKITNIILDFITLNPKYADILKQNYAASQFLKSIGLNLD